ncbi:MAG TPA: GNAT family N-acetyltransferase [Solirubrobacterales bacterium]
MPARTQPTIDAAPRVALLSPDDPDWLEFAAGHPAATPFHHPAWTATLAEAYGFDGSALVLRDGDDGTQALLPLIRVGRGRRRRAVALPFTDSLGPLVDPALDPAALAERLERVRVELGLGALEVRDALAAGVGERAPVGYRHVLDLRPGETEVRAGFHRSRVERKLRRAEREGLELRISADREALLEAFLPLHVATRRRLGVPVQPRRFFDALHERMLGRGLGFVASAHRDGEPVAAAVYLGWNGRLVYKFSAADRSHGDLGGAQAVVWEAIRWGCANGFAELDFGRTEEGHEGLRTFKSSWGTQEIDLAYTSLGGAPARAGSGRAAALLAAVLRRSPELLTRAVGRVAYRYTA